jgi:hypothetical protein
VSRARLAAILGMIVSALPLCAAAGTAAPAAAAGEARWRLEQPPPRDPSGAPYEGPPIGLGKVGDIEFWAPNRGLLITAGNGPSVPPGLWSFDGQEWHPLTGSGPSGEGVCGASDGRIAWAGADDFWTVSDERPGQAKVEGHEPPREDNTLCHFANGEVTTSYASLAFRPDSYQPMHAAGCISENDCWFAGDPLPAPEADVAAQPGAFHLHWNGTSVEAQPYQQGHTVEDMRLFGRYLFESVRIAAGDELGEPEPPSAPSLLHLITPVGVQPTFLLLTPGVPVYGPNEPPTALGALRLGADRDALWGAASPAQPSEPREAQVTIVRYSREGMWGQALGPATDPEGSNPFTKFPFPASPGEAEANESITSIAPDPGTNTAWLALSSPANERADRAGSASAMLARISSDGTVLERQTLPTPAEAAEGVRPKGAADKLACPAPHECWLVTTKGWLFHLSDGTPLPRDTDPAFSKLINFRPPDAGVPAVVPDAPPPDDSGLLGETPPPIPAVEAQPEARVTLPLITHLRTRVVKGRTLKLSFHLAVRARVRLLARRHGRLVASTAMRTFAAGNRQLLLKLDPRHWPTRLDLQTHALGPLPTTTHAPSSPNLSTSLSTSMRVLPALVGPFAQGTLP